MANITETLPKDISRAIMASARLLPAGARITLEGTPIYTNQGWNPSHDFGTNLVLPAFAQYLSDAGHPVEHFVLIDDFTTGTPANENSFTSQMAMRPTQVRFESEFVQEAESIVEHFISRGKTISSRGRTLLATGRQPVVRTETGRVACAVLDACYQRQKGESENFLIHPNDFIHQQEEMRDVLTQITGGILPGIFINVFFKKSVGRLLFTDRYGNTKPINY